MSLFALHPLAFTTAYSELKRRALELEQFFVGTPGSVGTARDHERNFAL